MHEGKRPGGLTALAVLNFVGSAFNVIGIISMVGMVLGGPALADMMEKEARKGAERRAESMGEDPAEAEITEEEAEAIKVMRTFADIDRVALGAWAFFVVACSFLLIVSGVGYLKQRRWGRLLGNLYAAVSIGTNVFEINLIPYEIGGGFRFASLVAFIYPVLTLILLNTTFKEDLAR